METSDLFINPSPSYPENTSMYTAAIWSCAAADQLADIARRLLPDHPTELAPRSFVRSLSNRWIARFVVVRFGTEIVGIVYAKEQMLANIPTGIIYGDGSLGNLVLTTTEHREAVLRVSVRALLDQKHVEALRLLLPSDGHESEIVNQVAMAANWSCRPVPVIWNHARLALHPSYDTFLNSLGYRTRRNFRYYRRKFEAAQHRYIPQLTATEIRAAVDELKAKCRVQSSWRAMQRKLKWVIAEPHHFVCGLRSSDGAWLSLAAGYYGATRATLVLQQNNDEEFDRESLSTVLRAYLIESFIAKGIRELIFWGGPGGALVRYAEFVPAIRLFIDSPRRLWRIARQLAGWIAPIVPFKARQELDWISPNLSPPHALLPNFAPDEP